jgi:hypothetical protein
MYARELRPAWCGASGLLEKSCPAWIAVRLSRDASLCGDGGAANVKGLPPPGAGPIASVVALVLGALKLRPGHRPEEDAQVRLAESLGMFPQCDPDRIHLICTPKADRHPISRIVLSEDVG